MVDSAEHDGVPADTISKLARTWSSLGELLAELSESDWKTATDVPGWSVQDHLSHLIGTERKLQGLAPAAPLTSLPEHVRNEIGERNEAEVAARRDRPGAEVLLEWNELVAIRLATLRSADATYFAAPTMTPLGPGTVADFLHIRVMDCWVHEQDIRRTLNRPGHTDGPAAEHSVDRLLRGIPMIVAKRAGAPDGATVRFRLSGPVYRTVEAAVHEGRARFVPTSRNEPSATVMMDSDTFVRLANGRATLEALADQVRLSGDVALAGRIAANLNIMI